MGEERATRPCASSTAGTCGAGRSARAARRADAGAVGRAGRPALLEACPDALSLIRRERSTKTALLPDSATDRLLDLPISIYGGGFDPTAPQPRAWLRAGHVDDAPRAAVRVHAGAWARSLARRARRPPSDRASPRRFAMCQGVIEDPAQGRYVSASAMSSHAPRDHRGAVRRRSGPPRGGVVGAHVDELRVPRRAGATAATSGSAPRCTRCWAVCRRGWTRSWRLGRPASDPEDLADTTDDTALLLHDGVSTEIEYRLVGFDGVTRRSRSAARRAGSTAGCWSTASSPTSPSGERPRRSWRAPATSCASSPITTR